MKKLLQFKAVWCGPCKMIAPLINEYSDKYDIQTIDVDENPELCAENEVRKVPTVIIISDDGSKIKLVGAEINKKNLENNS